MTTSTTEQVIDPRVQYVLAHPDLCVASGIGPDGQIDGILIFGLKGLVELTDDGLCRFPLSAIE